MTLVSNKWIHTMNSLTSIQVTSIFASILIQNFILNASLTVVAQLYFNYTEVYKYYRTKARMGNRVSRSQFVMILHRVIKESFVRKDFIKQWKDSDHDVVLQEKGFESIWERKSKVSGLGAYLAIKKWLRRIRWGEMVVHTAREIRQGQIVLDTEGRHGDFGVYFL